MCKQLVWDYKNGDIICADNGEVVDRIYDYGYTIYRDRENEVYYVIPRESRKYEKEMKKRIKRYHRMMRIYRKAMAIQKRNNDIIIDVDKIIRENGRMVKTITHKRSIEAMKKLSDIDRKYIEIGEKLINEKAPWMLSRSIRGKLAMCYIAGFYSMNGVKPSKSVICEKFNVSFTTIGRLEKMLISVGLLGF